jgi:SAM-dependent methyltransferase
MERTYGSLYGRLSSSTMAEVEGRVPRGSNVIDFGAGCGRLTLPLAQAGYRVTAVEPSAGMHAELTRSLEALPSDTTARVTAAECSMEHYRGAPSHDLALCVFTVIAFLLEPETLSSAFEAASGSLKTYGLFLLDVPHESVFVDIDYDDDQIIRTVQICPMGGRLYKYSEHTVVRTEKGEETYRDQFPIRRWTRSEVSDALHTVGFVAEADVSDRFAGLGADYLLMRKA